MLLKCSVDEANDDDSRDESVAVARLDAAVFCVELHVVFVLDGSGIRGFCHWCERTHNLMFFFTCYVIEQFEAG